APESAAGLVPEPVKRDPVDVMLTGILKLMASCPSMLPTVLDENLDEAAFPPLFDSRGGEKRRAIREDEDARLGVDQDEVVETRESSEGEPESSGSHALGGEPEDREPTRSSLGFDVRRTAQPPIQRSSNDGIFGPALNSGALGGGFSQAAS